MGLVPIRLIATALLLSTSSAVLAEEKRCNQVKFHSSFSERAIEFIFDRAYPCGQYANGDWWVSQDSSGYVQINSITPAARNGVNGFEINPSSGKKQAFDRRITGYDASLLPALPLKISGKASIIKSISALTEKANCLPCLQFAAVLTVLDKPALNSSEMLRPGYYGDSKSNFFISHLGKVKLPQLKRFCCSAVGEVTFDKLAQRYSAVQLDHIEGWGGRSLHPANNMPNYGAEIARDNAVELLRMLLDDFDTEKLAHRKALIAYLQMSVDLLSMAENGIHWPADGGHGNGRKLPLLFAGYLLGDERFFTAVRRTRFSEDEQVFFSSVANRALYGRQCSDSQYWQQQVESKGPKDCRDPYGFIDGGGKEIGEGYQYCCTAMPWKYTALAIRLLKLEKQWANDAFLQYVDRWVTHGAWASPDPCAGYTGKASDYGVRYGTISMSRCVDGKGRFMDKHGSNRDSGYYGSKLGDQIWQAYASK